MLRIRDVYPGSCFLSIPDPGYCFLSIPDPGSNNSNKKGEEKSHKYPKFVNYFIFEQIKKINLRIRIHFIRIRIQHFRLNTDPDRIKYGSGSILDPARALMTKNWEKNYS
jgi:hypothetical protein